MIINRRALSALTLSVAACGLAGDASALDGRNAGSLLLYPEFDNRDGIVTLLTVTNVNLDLEDGSTLVEFRYIGKYGPSGNDLGCNEANITTLLTAGDTLTLITNFHNPDAEQGYVYVYSKDDEDRPTVHNFLTGNLMAINGISQFEYSMNPVAYSGFGDGQLTDLDEDEHLDMNGCEYDPNPDEILIPRFLGQGGPYESELIFIALSGGTAFETTVDFLIYNDNEEVFSGEYSFECWDRVPLSAISGIFSNDFLRDWTNHDPAEIIGASHLESGWMRIHGHVANSQNTVIQNPSIYAVLIEKVADRGATDLPFERGVRTNGELLPRSNQGDLIDATCR